MQTKKEKARQEQAAKAQEAIKLAKENLPKAAWQDSAQLCIDDALACLGRGEYTSAIDRAAKSLAYSLGTFSTTYNQVKSWI